MPKMNWKCLLIGICSFLAVTTRAHAEAPSRIIYSVVPPFNYMGAVIYNPSSVNQTVTIKFISAGFTIVAGGFVNDYNNTLGGLPPITGTGSGLASGTVTGIGAQYVSCSTINLCTALKTIPPNGFLRAAVSVMPPSLSPLAGAGRNAGFAADFTTSGDQGLAIEVDVAESQGFIVGSAVSFLDMEGAVFGQGGWNVEAPFSYPLNSGQPF